MDKINRIELPKWNQLPAIDLYLEQMISYINDVLKSQLDKDEAEDMAVTRTMVNNYVKHEFIPAPINKKYNRQTVASLLVIAILKSVFTMEEISRLIELAIDANAPKASYDNFCKQLGDITENMSIGQFMKVDYAKEDPRNICYFACCTFASQYYVKKIFLNK